MAILKTELENSVLSWVKSNSGQLFNRTSDIWEIEGGYKNQVFYYFNGSDKYILRIKNGDKTKLSFINEEIDFINHLKVSQVSVATPILSKNNQYIEQIQVMGTLLYVSAFEFAKGRKLNYKEYLGNEMIYQNFGSITGKMHLASKKYVHKSDKRKTYINHEYISDFSNYIPKEYNRIHEALNQIICEISSLKKSSQNYGLIHGDINIGNCHIDQDTLILFDFDECHYSWYIEDLAIQLFYTIYVYGESSKEERYQEARRFLSNFLKEYSKYIKIDDDELRLIPLFLRLREMIVLVGIFKRWSFESLNQWQKDYFQDTLLRIESQTPIYDINDFINNQ